MTNGFYSRLDETSGSGRRQARLYPYCSRNKAGHREHMQGLRHRNVKHMVNLTTGSKLQAVQL